MTLHYGKQTDDFDQFFVQSIYYSGENIIPFLNIELFSDNVSRLVTYLYETPCVELSVCI